MKNTKNLENQNKTKTNHSNLEEYRIPTCSVCEGQLRNFFTRVRHCTLCGAKKSTQHKVQIGKLLGQRSMAFFMLCEDLVGGYDKLMEIVASFSDDGVLLQSKGAKAGSLPGAFWWVKKEIGEFVFSEESQMITEYKIGIPTTWIDFHHALVKFYSPEGRKVTHSKATSFLGGERTAVDKIIKSYLHVFMTQYGGHYKRIDEGEAEQSSFEIIEEPLMSGITLDIINDVDIEKDIKISSILPILKFCAEKKLATDVVSSYTRRIHIIYDLPLERLYDDLQYVKPS